MNLSNTELVVLSACETGLEEMKEFDWVGTELAKFNLETNLSPREFVGDCFSLMEKENNDQLGVIKEHLKNTAPR